MAKERLYYTLKEGRALEVELKASELEIKDLKRLCGTLNGIIDSIEKILKGE